MTDKLISLPVRVSAFVLVLGSVTAALAQGPGNNSVSNSGNNRVAQGTPNNQGYRRPVWNQTAGQGQGSTQDTDMPFRGAMRQRMMQRFDSNGDGKLDDNERAQMKAFMEQRRQQRGMMMNQGQGGGPAGGWNRHPGSPGPNPNGGNPNGGQ